MKRLLLILLMASPLLAQRSYTILDRSGWTVNATEWPGFALSNMRDSSSDTKWVSASGQGTIEINLGSTQQVSGIMWWPRQNENDGIPQTWSIYTATATDCSNYGSAVATGTWAQTVYLHSATWTPASVRCVKLIASAFSTFISASELYLVNGSPIWTSAESSYTYNKFNSTWALLDTVNGTGTIWNCSTFPCTVSVDMGAAVNFNSISFSTNTSAAQNPKTVEVYVSDNGSSWGTAVTTASLPDTKTTHTITLSSAANKRYFKLNITEGWESAVSLGALTIHQAPAGGRGHSWGSVF
jgi:hypothetical protein